MLTLKRSKKAIDDACKCGRFLVDHIKIGKRRSLSIPDFCAKFRPRVKPAHVDPPSVAAPPGALTLMRPDTVHPKAMGWASSHGPSLLEVYLSQLKTASPNQRNRFFGSKMSRGQLFAMTRGLDAKLRDRVHSAVKQGLELHYRDMSARLLRLSYITIGRVCSGAGLDDDNLVAAMKFIVDGIARTFEVDDRTFGEGKAVDVIYRAEKPGKRGTRGVRIELEFT